jgi:hypothetical protein
VLRECGRQLRPGCGGRLLDQRNDLVAHLRLDAAELVLDVYPVRLAQLEQVGALHVQLTGQNINPNFLFLQAELPVLTI